MTATAVTEPDWQTFANGITTADDELAAEAGWRRPVQITEALWNRACIWLDSDDARKASNDEPDTSGYTGKAPRGGCGTVLYLAALSARGNRTTFEVHVVPRSGRAIKPRPMRVALRYTHTSEGQLAILLGVAA